MSNVPWARLRKIGSNGVLTNSASRSRRLRDLVHDVDVEALVVGRAGRTRTAVGDVRADLQLARLDRAECRRWTSAVVVVAAAGGHQHGGDQRRASATAATTVRLFIRESPFARGRIAAWPCAAARRRDARRFPRLGRMARASPQQRLPYLDALRAYAARDPGRFHVPGHKGGPAADPALRRGVRRARRSRSTSRRSPRASTPGPSRRRSSRRRQLAAEAWGARRTWFLINGASQGNHAACLALAQSRRARSSCSATCTRARSTG